MSLSAVLAASMMACAVPAQPGARHQCRGWIPTEAHPDRTGDVYAVASVDPDGPGPKTSMLLFGNRAWDGRRYQSLPTGRVDDIRAMVWADLDGQGAQPPVLFGASAPLAAFEQSRVYQFTGFGWQATSAVFDSWPDGTLVNAITPFDPDGAGAAPTGLYAGGTFTTPGAYLMRWDGGDWTAVPSNPITAPVRTLCVFDPDGTGPLASRLVAGGEFQNAASSNGDFVVQWTGTSWLALGTGLNGVCSASAVFDPDGAGPLAPRLFVGGTFTQAGGQPASNVAQFNGTSWSSLGTGVNGPVESLVVVDPDADGPLPARLVVSGTFTSAGGSPAEWAAQWNGSSWSPLSVALDGMIHGAVVYDPDNDGPALPAAAVCGSFSVIGGAERGDPVMWNGVEWYGITDALNAPSRAVVLFDPDDFGPEPPRPIAGGDFTRGGYVPCSYIAQRIGLNWRPMGEGVDGQVTALTLFQSRVIAGGSFGTAGGIPAAAIAAWNGSAWSPLGDGLDGPVTALTTFDPDGPGPLDRRLAVGGMFTSAGGVNAPFVAVWNGSTWSSLSTGLNGPVNAITAYDPDGEGPEGDYLVVGGDFTMAGGQPADQLAQWNGLSWSQLGTPPGAAIYALASFDFDGEGPGGGTVYAGGVYSSGGGFVVELWVDTWYFVGADFDGPVRALMCFDPDDAEFLPPVLLAGGEFTANSISVTRGIATYEDGLWLNTSGGVEGAALAFGIGFDHDGAGLATHPVLTAGDFRSAGQKPASNFGLYSFGGEPSVPTPPRDTVGHFGGTVSFPIAAEGLLPVQYNWMKGEEFIFDGPTSGGGTYSGTGTSTLTISGLSASDADYYNCYVTSACGNSYSSPGLLLITCPADFNLDGFVDGIDSDQFNNAFDIGGIAADFNLDGFVDGIDYDQFNNAFDAGC